QPGLGGDLGPQGPQGLPGPAQRRQQVAADPGRGQSLGRPVAGADVQQGRGRGVGRLGPGGAGEPVAEQVGQQQQGPGRLQLGGAGGGGQLVDGVEGQQLGAGGGG